MTTAAASRTSPGIITDHQIRPWVLLTLLGQESEEGQVLGFRAQRRVTIARCRIGPAREIPAVTTTARSLKISQNCCLPTVASMACSSTVLPYQRQARRSHRWRAPVLLPARLLTQER